MKLEGRALIGVQALWDGEIHNEVLPQTSGNHLCFLVGNWKSQCIFGEMICKDQDVFSVTLSRLEGQEVHAHQFKRLTGPDIYQRCSMLWQGFLPHTAVTCPDPLFDIRSHARPEEPESNEVERSFNPHMPHIVMTSENYLAQLLRQHKLE